ncbi:hemolymph lipopolysaccharide-binding protein-like [Cydia splendana]|uniref:hemolymph lipopolysaccharide-binding protein-like n=1 Tax=Cydia splendana TaxID=1100963 RepID=UPI00300C16DE
MFQLIFLCAIFIGQKTAAVLDPGYEYVEEANTWLRLHIVPADWQDARVQCRLEGGVLASPSTTALTKAMLSMMTTYKVNLGTRCFTGIHDLVSKRDFMSLDGVSVTNMQLDWAHGEPSGNDENCLVLNGEGEIADDSCSSKYPFFCRKDNAANVSHECHCTHKYYEYHPRTGSCYKFHKEVETWHHAAKVCHAEGGHLAIINSNTEAVVIKDIFENYPEGNIIGPTYTSNAWVGVWKWNDRNGAWLTTTTW